MRISVPSAALAGATCLSLVAFQSRAAVIPIVLDHTVIASAVGAVPDEVDIGIPFPVPFPLIPQDPDVRNPPDNVAQQTFAASLAGKAERSMGEVTTTIVPLNVDASTIRPRSEVFTDVTDPTDTVDTNLQMTSNSAGGIVASLSTAGRPPGGSVTVDLSLNITASLIYEDPTGEASVFVFDPTLPELNQLDAAASISALFVVGEPIVIDATPLSFPPFETLFNGSVAIQPTEGTNTIPEVVRVGDWATNGTLTFFDATGVEIGGVTDCTSETFCRVDLDLQMDFLDVQSTGIGFGEQFDVGLDVTTVARAFSNRTGDGSAGRRMVADASNTAGFGVTFTETTTSVDEPAMLALLGLGLAGIGFSRKRRPH